MDVWSVKLKKKTKKHTNNKTLFKHIMVYMCGYKHIYGTSLDRLIYDSSDLEPWPSFK
jgi:hypothetical protein